ncbi:MAG: type II toxin-antitoxin system Phd/YefM family antitoxin [Anaerolineales bacterium]|nr:type II toxin-antitoxin system Phd/YefM family antitoxin [Anaerolineales bacterium]
MPQSLPQPTTISALYLRHHLGKIIHNILITKQRYVLEKSGIPVLALVPLQDMERLQKEDNAVSQ